jgi:hypothetical protein
MLGFLEVTLHAQPRHAFEFSRSRTTLVSAMSTRNAAEDIWGERTPYKHVWPTRVDQHTIEEPEKWIQGVCVMCRYVTVSGI